LSMQEVYWYIKGMANMPKRSVALTFDDGRGVENLVPILEEYGMNATAFVVGERRTDYWETINPSVLELQSHSYGMHNYRCAGKPGVSSVVCKGNSEVLADLKKSREVLDDAIAFCYPFYQYNSTTVKLVKEAGFLLAFGSNTGFTKIGSDAYRISRYTFSYNSSVQELANALGE